MNHDQQQKYDSRREIHHSQRSKGCMKSPDTEIRVLTAMCVNSLQSRIGFKAMEGPDTTNTLMNNAIQHFAE
jgi:hypothetical protein